MKRFRVTLAVALIYFFLSNQISFAQHKDHDMKSTEKADSTHQHHDKKTDDAKTKSDSPSTSKAATAKAPGSMKEIVGHYLDLKNALTNDNSKEAAAAGKAMFTSIGKLDKSALTADQKKIFLDVEEDAKEHAEHIGENVDNITHQREHFVMLSNDVYDLVKVFGNEQVLYKDFCPMYNNKKGGMWLSETKEIKNPYYGKKMLTCGSVKEEIK